MTLFTLLLVLICERLFKWGERWQLECRLAPLFRQQHHFSMTRTVGLVVLVMLVFTLILHAISGLLFGILSLIVWIVVGVLCIGAGESRQHYRDYLRSANQQDVTGRQAMAEELSAIHPMPSNTTDKLYLRELQNALLWINYRFYLAPLFWFVVGGSYGPVCLLGYAFLRAWQGWLAKQNPLDREKSGIDQLLFWIDWIPVRIVGLAYVFLGHGEKALPAWWRFMTDLRHKPYHVLSVLAQFSLERDPCKDNVEMPRIAVALAKRITLVVVLVTALLTLAGVIF
ncbi:beta-lactamase regulator AmpE [Rosenbergiella australiborealis]|uniref:beta-lactamase regulator AmpE n=1 Tax=Rosenbergiella australiborealis TaxID=1544696 RepID=UPI001F4DCD9D|nr:beta-lactamase regulator AmpE [Rosenbergiella australiborealis]